ARSVMAGHDDDCTCDHYTYDDCTCGHCTRADYACADHEMRIGVVVGLAAEARIARRLGWRVAIGGGTAAGAEAAANALVRQRCAGVISFGLAGGRDPTLRPGALIVPAGVIAGGKRYTADPNLS